MIGKKEKVKNTKQENLAVIDHEKRGINSLLIVSEQKQNSDDENKDTEERILANSI